MESRDKKRNIKDLQRKKNENSKVANDMSIDRVINSDK